MGNGGMRTGGGGGGGGEEMVAQGLVQHLKKEKSHPGERCEV